jgi:hypothetical protein
MVRITDATKRSRRELVRPNQVRKISEKTVRMVPA